MSSSSIKSKGKLTALGYIYVFISAIVFLLYWFVDAVDGRYASVLLLASCFVVRVHPAFSGATGKIEVMRCVGGHAFWNLKASWM